MTERLIPKSASAQAFQDPLGQAKREDFSGNPAETVSSANGRTAPIGTIYDRQGD